TLRKAAVMTTLRGWTALLMLLLAASGCRTTGSADPLGLENPSMLSGLVPQRSGPGRAVAARGGAAASGDPFIQSAAQTAANQSPASQAGRATISDAFGEDHEESTSRDATYLAAQPVADRAAEVIPVEGRAKQGDGVVQAVAFDPPPAAAPIEAAAGRPRLP